MAYSFFKELSEEEKKEYRQWARSNYTIGDHISPIWHPVVVDECMAMLIGKIENGLDSKEQSGLGQDPEAMGNQDGEGNA